MYIQAIECSVDQMIVELCHSLLSSGFPSIIFDVLSVAKSTVFNIRSSTFKSKAHSSLCSCNVDHWNSTFEPLIVQNKFSSS